MVCWYSSPLIPLLVNYGTDGLGLYWLPKISLMVITSSDRPPGPHT